VACSDQRLLVADTDNQRVLIWNSWPQTSGALPDLVLGQADFNHCTDNDYNQDHDDDPFPSEPTLHEPVDLCTVADRLFVADQGNGRILFWDSLSSLTTHAWADGAIGKPSLLWVHDINAEPSQTYLINPSAIACGTNQLFVAEEERLHRVLIWHWLPTVTSAEAGAVLGQQDFVNAMANDQDQDGHYDGPAAYTLYNPAGLLVTAEGLWVVDSSNHRLLYFTQPPAQP
jgi:hypothetical protein